MRFTDPKYPDSFILIRHITADRQRERERVRTDPE